MKIDELDKDILLHIINLQRCIIEGKDIKSIFHKYMGVFREEIGTDIIAICAKEAEHIDFKYILEEKRLFVQMIKEHFHGRKQLSWDKFVEHCQSQFLEDTTYLKMNNFHQVFQGFLSKKDSDGITKGIGMKEAVIMPIYTKDDKERLGFVFYIFRSNTQVDLHKLKMATILFQSLLQPLYDKEHYTLYSKCVRVNNQLNLLTAQEKNIARKVLAGYSYPQIAKKMDLSINTIKSHVKHIFNKYYVTSKIELYKKLQDNE